MRNWAFIKHSRLPDLFFWGCLFAGWYFMRVTDFPERSVALYVTAVKVIILALLVYTTNYFLIPRFLYKKQYWVFGLLFMLMIISFGLFKVYLIIQLLQPHYNQRLYLFDDLRTKIYDDLLPLFLLVCTGAAVKLVMGYVISEKKIAEISREKAETELQFLKSQVNPHFVFNTLNSIYFQIDKLNQEARETLLQFSDLLRYQLYECNAEKIPIEKELAYLCDYVKLQEKRKDSTYKVEWINSGELKGFSIAPLLLMPLVENAFKHISHFTDKTNAITIHTESKDGTFHFSINNTTEAADSKKEMQYGGIGLKNVKRRLELLYPSKHQMLIKESDGTYSVQLKLQLHEN
jgi:two-component system, LytTR family, sensor kinase